MVCLHRTSALFFCCFLLLHRQVQADEEASWGPVPSKESLPGKRPSSYSWIPSLPKLPSLPSLPFRIPFYSQSERKDNTAVLATSGEELTGLINSLGSGEGSESEEAQPTIILTRGPLTSVAEIRTEALPTEILDFLYSSTVHSNNGTFVPPLTPSRPPSSTTTVTKPSLSFTDRHVSDKQSVHQENEGHFSTLRPNTRVFSALNWVTPKTMTANPGKGQTTVSSPDSLRAVTHTVIPETTSKQGSFHSTVHLHSALENPPTQSQSDKDTFGIVKSTEKQPWVSSSAQTQASSQTASPNTGLAEMTAILTNRLGTVSPAISVTTHGRSPERFTANSPLHSTLTTPTTRRPSVSSSSLTQATSPTTKLNPGMVKATFFMTNDLGTEPTLSETTSVRHPEYSTAEAAIYSLPTSHRNQSQSHLDLSESSILTTTQNKRYVTSTVPGIIQDLPLISLPSTTPIQRANFPNAEELPAKAVEDEDEAPAPSRPDASTVSIQTLKTPTGPGSARESPAVSVNTDSGWRSGGPSSDPTLLPDCNKDRSGICSLSSTWDPGTPHTMKPTENSTATNLSDGPPAPLMLVPLYTDWSRAIARWGPAWEVHVYGAGCVFATVTLASALNLLCLPLRCPSGCGYFALVSLFLLGACCTRSFSLLYDAYGHQERISSAEASLMLHEAPFPCLTAAFGLVFLLLSMRSRMQLSYSAFQRPCFLACLVVLHFGAAFGPVTFLKFNQQKPPLCLFISLIARGTYVALATFLSTAYFVFYIYVRADSKHIYHLNNTSPTPAERYNRCPFAESHDWNRAAGTVCLSALFSLACAGLQLYAMLNALGVAGGEEVFHPWPWWTFQFSCRLCEIGVCLTLALVVAQPVFCSDQLPGPGSCWTELLASKSPILPGTYQWTLSHQEKLAIVDTVGLGETESLPLYTLMDERLGSSLNGLDLLYHSNRALAYRDLDLDFGFKDLEKPEDGLGREPSGGSSFTSDSTADLRPPSPINLRRSIDEALFSEALFPMSLFSPVRPVLCSDTVNHWTLPNKGLCDPPSVDSGLYRTSSCLEMASQAKAPHGAAASPSNSSCSSHDRWRCSSSTCSLYRTSMGGSSAVLCPSPDTHLRHANQEGNSSHPQTLYQTLGAASQESLDLSPATDRSVQEEFISVCRQIDALSVCSETIDL